MKPHTSRRLAAAALAAAIGATLPAAALAIDGQILIDHARAQSGGVTTGDAAGYPVTISRSGSYKLSGNLSVADANTSAIVIAANNVTLDLNGFSIFGPARCTGSWPCANAGNGSGVETPNVQHGISVRNGSIEGMGHSAVRLKGSGHLVEYLHVQGNAYAGIHVIHDQSNANNRVSAIVQHCSAVRNGNWGIFVSDGIVRHNTASANRTHGLYLNRGLAAFNATSGNPFGLVAQDGAGYTGNVSQGNSSGNCNGYGRSLGHNLCGASVY